ncbi:MAG: helicase C-terminal domain-containing protein [Fibrobacterota bacterium]
MAKLSDMLSGESSKKMNSLRQKQKSGAPAHPRKHVPLYKRFRVRIPDFVSIDLETTGLNRQRDRITEVGLVRYIDGKETECFSTLVNPGIPIPPDITALTGITDDMVSQAPPFAEVMNDIRRFIGRLALCAHKVDFDFNFLNAEFTRNGAKTIRNWRIDTLSTARLLLNLDEGYALGKVARALDVSLENAHRALDDARAGGEVALKLLPMIADVPVHTRYKLAKFAPYSFVKKILETSVKGYSPAATPPRDSKTPAEEKSAGDPEFLLSPAQIHEDFDAEGHLSTRLKEYYPRPDQRSYAEHVGRTLNSAGTAVIEAGTGIGKSLGYTLPAVRWALGRRETVIISTNTKNLQDQLMKQELPLAQSIVDRQCRCTVLKGKGNYLCLKGWESFLNGETGSLSPGEREAILPLIKWVDETKTGDIEEQNVFNHHRMKHLWQLISAENRSCRGCSHFERCFMQQARRRAHAADIVVINHALFFSDIVAETEFIGRAGAIIFDEAHQLVPRAYSTLTCEIDTRRVDALIEYAQETLNTLKGYRRQIDNALFERGITDLTKAVKRLRKNGGQFLNELMTWIGKHRDQADEIARGITALRYGAKEFYVYAGLSGLRIGLNDTIDMLEFIKRGGFTQLENSIAMNEVRGGIEQLRQFRADLEYLTESRSRGHIFWATAPRENPKWVKLSGTPLEINDLLRPFWERFPGALIFTSATLSPDRDLAYFSQRVGIDSRSPHTEVYESHFEPENIRALAVRDAPLPADAEYTDYLISTLRSTAELKRNTLVLFTSNMLLSSVYNGFVKACPEAAGRIFAQGISGNRSWIQEQMKEVEGAILLGSGSFWEGIDIPGAACEIVIIPKLPFPVPSHPITKALSDSVDAAGGSGFMDYYLQEAVLTFRQGMGRLIRHRDDRGVLVVLDSRMVNKSYGKRFLRASPSPFGKIDSDAIVPEIDSFLSGD